MEHLDQLRESLPTVARDVKINLGNVLTPGTLNAAQVWGVAIACAYTTRNKPLIAALVADAKQADAGTPVLEDAQAAAILMGMNNVFYRFRHIVGNDEYSEKPARLRMQRINQPATNKADFELFCLAVSAIGNCQTCIRSHEHTVVEHGLTSDHINDAVRIAAVIQATAIALDSILPE